jgi:acetyl-CoA synthetase (ADP-forming)
MKILEDAVSRGARTLSENQSKQLLTEYGVPVTRETIAATADEAVKAADAIGYPVVLKGSGEQISHKTEMNLIALDLSGEAEVREAFARLTSSDEVDEVLVQQMVKGDRELVVGMTRDAQFGPCVMFGLGGVFTEVLQDVAFRVAPLSRRDAMEMLDDIRARKILETFRGKPAVDREMLADILINVGRMGLEQDSIREIDINPLKVPGGKPVAVDALVVLESDKPEG